MFLSKWVICRFHVNLPGCIRFDPYDADLFLILQNSPSENITLAGSLVTSHFKNDPDTQKRYTPEIQHSP